MKPILKVHTLLCFQDKSGSIFEEHGVKPYQIFVYPSLLEERKFIGKIGEYTIKIELIIK